MVVKTADSTYVRRGDILPNIFVRIPTIVHYILQARTLVTVVLKVFLVRLPESDALSDRQERRR